MEPGQVYSLTRVTYARLLAEDVPVYGFVTGARWVNIDNPGARAAAEQTLAERAFAYPP
jgi:NDP-sugar pyrophosphorylase family protein